MGTVTIPESSVATQWWRRDGVSCTLAATADASGLPGRLPATANQHCGYKRCVQEKMPAVDCSQAADPARCQRHQNAREQCRDKIGPEHRQCLREALAPAAR